MCFLFEENVHKYFGYLTEEYNFQCTTSKKYDVIFESQHLIVSICFDRNRSYEVSIKINLKDQLFKEGRLSFYLWEILEYHKDTEFKDIPVFADTQQMMNNLLKYSALALKKYADGILRYDILVISNLNKWCLHKSHEEFEKYSK